MTSVAGTDPWVGSQREEDPWEGLGGSKKFNRRVRGANFNFNRDINTPINF